MSKLGGRIDKTVPLEAQIRQVELLSELLMNGAVTSLIDPELASVFREAYAGTHAETIRAGLLADTQLTGSALDRQVLDKLTSPLNDIRFPDQVKGCFIAGTLVHTDKGLKPIEEIKVGDRVLSKPENCDGEQEYKRVVKTLFFERKNIRAIEYLIACDHPKKFDRKILFVTDNHPFWVKNIGWTAALYLEYGQTLELLDGSKVVVWRNMEICGTQHHNIGVVVDRNDADNDFCVQFESDGQVKYLDRGDHQASTKSLTRDVYNFEVEDFHTYYVDPAGVWVHNFCRRNI